ncbi:MAG: BrnA antitoxin family protein [Proteobacteria bacterium]|nr:BrnA antitoxin family protein [Pseudomonadota bacterium]
MKKQYDKPLSPEELAALPDAAIDTSDIPPLDRTFWNNARVVMPGQGKRQLTVRFDGDMLDWFKAQGKGYQTRMNAVLRSYYEAHKS